MSDTPKQPETADRLAKVIARAGLCSRRDAEGWIADGRISVNGKKVVTPAFNVTSKDKIEVDGLPLAARQGTRVWLYNKPAGLVVTEKDPEGRPTIFEALEEKGLPRVLTVGRLDINTEGLLLLTNDGGLKRVLELPSTGWLRRYRVRAFGEVTQSQLDSLKNGITVEGVQYGPITATLEREQGANVWLVLGLREGKNREVKNVLGSLGLEVNRLIRISYGPFQLGDLAEGAVEAVKSRMLRDQLGKKLAESAGVDFESAIPDLPATPRSDLPVRSPRDRDLGRGNAGRGATRRPNADTEERPMGRPRRVHFEDDGRAPEVYTPKGAGRGRPDRDDQPARSFGKPEGRKSFGDRPARSGDGDRPSRGSFGDRPKRDFGDRPQRAFGDKPARGARPDRGFEDRPKRSFGDKPSRGSFGDKPRSGGFEDRPKRAYGDKPARSGRPERSFEDRPKRDSGDRPKRSYGDAPTRGARPERGNEERPQRSGKPFGDRKPFAKRDGDAPRGGKSFGSAKPFGGKSFGSRPGGSRPEGGRPSNSRPSTGRPTGGRPTGGRPSNTRPSSGPRKPRG